LLHCAEIVREPLAPNDIGAGFRCHRRDTERYALWNGIGLLHRCSRLGQLVARGDDEQPRPREYFERGEIGPSGRDNGSAVEKSAGG
jgi:hypothetical protein